jgi:L-alanine-DL-glutamate epimerase-like enolase superfamily enzyme
VRVPLPAPVALATMRITARDYTIVEIVDEDGAMGRAVGYARGAPVADVVERMLAPSWQGAEVAEPTALYDRTVRANAMQGTHGIFWRALSLSPRSSAARSARSRRRSPAATRWRARRRRQSPR